MTHPKKPREESYQQARAVYEFLKRPDVKVIETLARNIDTAERRGFEMAKHESCKMILDDAYAITFQTMGQYRTQMAKSVANLKYPEA